jgi:hypothetical protein
MVVGLYNNEYLLGDRRLVTENEELLPYLEGTISFLCCNALLHDYRNSNIMEQKMETQGIRLSIKLLDVHIIISHEKMTA